MVSGQPGLCGWPALGGEEPPLRTGPVSPAGAPHSASSTSLHSERSSGHLAGLSVKPEGLHQRSYSVSSADQWSEAVATPSGTPNPGEPVND